MSSNAAMKSASSKDRIMWNLPKDYRAYALRKRKQDPRRKLLSWKNLLIIAAAAIGVLAGQLLFHTSREESILGGIVFTVLGVLASEIGAPILMDRFETAAGYVYSRGVNAHKWQDIRWYQFADVPDFPHLRALVVGLSNGDEKIDLVVFDPRDVNEAALAEFVDRFAPGKRWQH